LSNFVNLIVGQQRPVHAFHTGALRCGDVSLHGASVGPRISRDLPMALPRRPAAKHFSNVDHGQLPVGHGFLPTATSAVVEKNPVSSGRSTRAWLHHPAEIR
jgi:hypothetical protein